MMDFVLVHTVLWCIIVNGTHNTWAVGGCGYIYKNDARSMGLAVD